MVGNESVNYAQLLDTANVLQNSSNDMKDIFSRIESVVNSVNGAWQSSASQEYINQFNQLKTKFPMFYEAVQNYSKFLNNTVETYQAADKALAENAGNNLVS